MAGLLVGLGYAVGFTYAGPTGGEIGVGAALLLWILLCLTAFTGGDTIMLATAGARKIEKRDLPRLFNVVEEMTIAAGLPRMPEIYLIESNSPNAFAVGTPKRSAVAVTTGLLSRLNRDELQGVIAHEIGHISNYDSRFMVLAGVLVGSIVLIADLFLRGLYYGALTGRSRRSSRSGGDQGQAIFLIVAIVLSILAPLFAHLLYLACSRKREYLADASSARFTRYPEGLASALEKIDAGLRRHKSEKSVNRVVAPMYIVNPLAVRGAAGLFSTHPPTEKRIKILRSMAGGASLAQYEEAYRKITGGEPLLGPSALREEAPIPTRPPSAEPEPSSATRRREVMDSLYQLDGFRFALCPCGVKLKVPPDFKGHEILCPSCGREVPVGAPGTPPPTSA